MTIEKLEKYYGICSRIETIKDELRTLTVVKSPKLSGTMGSEPGNPTERIAFKTIDKEEYLNELLEDANALKAEVDDWKDHIEDGEIASIVYWHYIKRLDWSKTNRRVYGYPSYDYSRKKISRYFEKLSELSE